MAAAAAAATRWSCEPVEPPSAAGTTSAFNAASKRSEGTCTASDTKEEAEEEPNPAPAPCRTRKPGRAEKRRKGWRDTLDAAARNCVPERSNDSTAPRKRMAVEGSSTAWAGAKEA